MEKQKEKAGEGRDFIEERLGLRMPLATASLSLGNMPRLALILPYQAGHSNWDESIRTKGVFVCEDEETWEKNCIYCGNVSVEVEEQVDYGVSS